MLALRRRAEVHKDIQAHGSEIDRRSCDGSLTDHSRSAAYIKPYFLENPFFKLAI